MRTNFEHLILNWTDQSKYFPISLLVLEVHEYSWHVWLVFIFNPNFANYPQHDTYMHNKLMGVVEFQSFGTEKIWKQQLNKSHLPTILEGNSKTSSQPK